MASRAEEVVWESVILLLGRLPCILTGGIGSEKNRGKEEAITQAQAVPWGLRIASESHGA